MNICQFSEQKMLNVSNLSGFALKGYFLEQCRLITSSLAEYLELESQCYVLVWQVSGDCYKLSNVYAQFVRQFTSCRYRHAIIQTTMENCMHIPVFIVLLSRATPTPEILKIASFALLNFISPYVAGF